MPRMGFEPTISAGERPKSHALDRAATGTGEGFVYVVDVGADGMWVDLCHVEYNQNVVNVS